MKNTVSKAEWISMFREIGLDDQTMLSWHRLFEQRHPVAHEAFLQWLGLTPSEVEKIRSDSC